MKSVRPALALTAALLALSACDDKSVIATDKQTGPNPVLPEPKAYLLPPMKIADAVGWKAGETPTVPAGMKVEALATGFMHPRQVYTLPNGDVLVVEGNGPKQPVYRPKDKIAGLIKGLGGTTGKGGNRITLLRYTPGQPVERHIFVEHLFSPFGVVLVGNNLYVANTDALLRFPYQTGQTHIDATPEKVTDLPGGPIDHHWTKSLTASPDGSKLYVGVGSNSNITENGLAVEMNRAAVWEIDPKSGAFRIFASGTRNPTGVAFDPHTGKLWACVNERDELGPDLVPDYVTSVKDGAFYGWPYSYYGQHLDPRVKPQRPDLVAKAIKPDYAMGSHVAPLGLTFYNANGLPPKYQGGLFVSEHGSWDRSPLSGYKVVYVAFQNGQPVGVPQDVVTGFLNGKDQARGRPVGLTVDKSGALLVADDVGNTVWRVSSATQTASR